jgi:predicted RNA-binding Zn ribbon-like protein
VDAIDLLGIADHPALEFLNSTSDATGPRLDVITDGDGLLAWLTTTGLLSEVEASSARRAFSRSELDTAAADARDLREEMRPTIAAWSRAEQIPKSALNRLNALLAEDRRYAVIDHHRRQLRLRESHDWSSARSLLALPAAALADLITEGDPTLVRHCEGVACTMWFYDRTKSHRRRWCRMSVCGNRAKAATHRSKNQATPQPGRGPTTAATATAPE